MTARRDLHAALVPLVAGLAVCGVFAALAAAVHDAVVRADGIAVIDRPVLSQAVDLRRPLLTDVVARFTDLGGTLGLTILVVLAAVLLATTSRSVEPLVLVAATAAGSVSLTVIGKAVIARDRPPFVDAVPPLSSSSAFPSGHSLNSLALIGVLAYLAVREWRRRWARVLTLVASSLFVLAMGLSRVYLGQHWPTDVLGAWFIASAWLTVVVTSHRLHLGSNRARRRPAPAQGRGVPGTAARDAGT